MNVKSIQLAHTLYCAELETFEVVAARDANHVSVYLRDVDGYVEPERDFPMGVGTKQAAMIRAAKLSMQYGVPIESNSEFM